MSKRCPPSPSEGCPAGSDHLDEYPSAYAAAHAIGPMVDVHPETLRVWILKAKASDTGPARRTAPTPGRLDRASAQ